MDNQLGQKGKIRLLQGLPIATESIGVRLIAKLVAQVRNSPMAQIDQMLRGLTAGWNIVNHYRVNKLPGMLVVYQNDRDLQPCQPGDIQRAAVTTIPSTRRSWNDSTTFTSRSGSAFEFARNTE